MPVDRSSISTAVHPVMTYGTTSYADIMAMLHSVRITPEVKAHVGRRLMKESESRHLTDAYERLDHLATLQEDWDGYGALPISPVVIDNVKAVLLISDNGDWKEWLIAPDSNATLCLEAKSTGASISIGAKEFSYFARIDGKRYGESHVSFTPQTILGIMRKLS